MDMRVYQARKFEHFSSCRHKKREPVQALSILPILKTGSPTGSFRNLLERINVTISGGIIDPAGILSRVGTMKNNLSRFEPLIRSGLLN
jgi:hypothetical protein